MNFVIIEYEASHMVWSTLGRLVLSTNMSLGYRVGYYISSPVINRALSKPTQWKWMSAFAGAGSAASGKLWNLSPDLPPD